MIKLGAKRFRYTISNGLSLNWFNRQQPAQQKPHILSKVASDPIACIVRGAADVPIMALTRGHGTNETGWRIRCPARA